MRSEAGDTGTNVVSVETQGRRNDGDLVGIRGSVSSIPIERAARATGSLLPTPSPLMVVGCPANFGRVVSGGYYAADGIPCLLM